VEIPDVVSFRFTDDNTIVFTLKNGNTVELTDYQGIEFSIEPAPVTSNSKWDLEKTLEFGGASYTWYGELTSNYITFAIVHKNGTVFHVEQNFSPNQMDKKFNMDEINQEIWEINGRLSVWSGSTWSYGMSYMTLSDGLEPYIILKELNTPTTGIAAKRFWSFNNNTNIIPTAIIQNPDGSITMNCTDYMGVVHSYTFTGW
jgi:hypothetical protein